MRGLVQRGLLAQQEVGRHALGRSQARCMSTGSDPISSLTTWRGRARFYGDVDVVESKTHPGRYEIELDKRRLRTPAQNVFQLPSKPLAVLVAQEWDAQICQLETSTMPITMQCAMAIDVTGYRREAVFADMMRFLNTDMVCFPQRLLQPGEYEEVSGERERFYSMQQERWGKALKHFTSKYGRLEILDSDTLRSPKHDPVAYAKARARLEELCDFKLTAITELAKGCKGLVLPLSLLDGVLTSKETFEAARVEEDHQITNWGLVEGHHDVDKEALLAQIASASLVLRLAP